MLEVLLEQGEAGRIIQIAFYQHGFGESLMGSFVLRGDQPPGGLARDATVYKFSPNECPLNGRSDYRTVVADDGKEDTWIVNALNASPRCSGCGYIYDLVYPVRFNFAPIAER